LDALQQKVLLISERYYFLSTAVKGSHMTPSQSPWGDSETKFFFELTPTVILESVETSLGVRSTGRVMALNSLENRVYDVELDDEQNSHVVAKFYRPNRWTKEQILEEHQFLADLDHAEINVVRPLVFQDGSTLVTLAESGLRLAVFPKVRGRSPDELTTDHLRELGRLLARVHVVGSSRKASHRLPITPETYGSSSLTYLMGSPLLPPFIARDFEQTVKDLLAVINPLFQAIKPTEVIRLHGDCHLGNLIQTQRGLTLVDFDDMVVGPPVQDLWLLLPG
jgi:Ser/Thr protein kinase RdoA (MazF antagonist)